MNRFALLASFVIAGVMLGGCPETAHCPEGQVRVNRACVDRDASGTDGGGDLDGGIDDAGSDGGPCGECPATAQYCVVDRDGAPACRECDPNQGNETCVDVAGRPYCDRDTEACVECTANEHCTSAGASFCNDDNVCVPCSEATHCEHVRGEGDVSLDVCNAGTCVECTEATEAADCGGLACDGLTGRCTTTVRNRDTCAECDSDTQCRLPMRCIPMNYAGAPTGRSYCMRPVSEGCDVPYSVPLDDRPSASGRPADDYCGINETNVTCEAVLAYGQMCGAGGDADDCNGAGASRCGTLSGTLMNRCTYACTSPIQCVGMAACVSGQCQ